MSFRFSGRLLLDIQISVSLFLSSISSILVVFDCRYFCDHQKNQLYEIKSEIFWKLNLDVSNEDSKQK